MYTTPKPGTVLPAQENTTVSNPGPVGVAGGHGTDEWLQAQAQNQAFTQNLDLILAYQNQFQNSWLPSYQTGTLNGPTGIKGDPNATPLQPPAAFQVLVTNPYGDTLGFDVVQGSAPVCAVPAYTKIAPPWNPANNKIKSDPPYPVPENEIKPGDKPLTAAEQPDKYKRAHHQRPTK
jgi:hypothetical protein